MGHLLVFDLVGQMAHFRKFYSNSSSLSYHLPPRTVVAGMVGALLGFERDAYQAKLGLDCARIGVALKVPVRTVVQTVNYLNTSRGEEDWCGGFHPRTQIPVEFVVPHLPERLLRYRIYLSHADGELVEELYRQLCECRYRYPLYLGLTECPAWAEEPRFYPAGSVEVRPAPPGPMPVGTAVPAGRLVGGMLLREGLRVYKDRMPLDLHPDRRLKAVGDVLWEAGGKALELALSGEVFRLPGEEVWGVFLE
jgi:CRISPR-associated protein Cas5h